MIVSLFVLALLQSPQAAPPGMTQPALDVWIERTLTLDGGALRMRCVDGGRSETERAPRARHPGPSEAESPLALVIPAEAKRG